MTKDDATWLRICYVAVALITSYVFFRTFETIGLENGWADKFDTWYAPVSRLFSLALGGGAVFFYARDQETYEFHLSAVAELRKVTWPTFEDVKRMTLIVAVVVAIFSVILGVFDIVWSKALQTILS